MTTLDGHVLAVRDFILGQACTNCVRTLRKDPEFDALIANALTTRPEPGRATFPEPHREERIVSTLAAAALLVVGAFLGGGFRPCLPVGNPMSTPRPLSITERIHRAENRMLLFGALGGFLVGVYVMAAFQNLAWLAR